MTDYVAELRKKRQTESVLKSIGTAERLAQQQQSVLQSIQSDSAARKSFNEYTANTRYGFGNVDLTNRPKYYNEDGSVSTVRSMSFYDEDEAREILVPTVASVGGTVRLLSDDEARARYYATGEHLGKFNTPEQATEYAMALHNAQQAQVERQRARTSFDFDEDEGTYRWNGKTYASREELTRAMNAAGLSAEEQTSVARKAQSSGSGVALHNNRFMSTEEQAQAIERERLAAIDLTAQKKKLDELKAQLRTEKAKSASGRAGRHRADADRAAQDRIAADIRTLEHEMIQAETVQKADDFYRVWQKQDFDATARKGGAKAGNLVMRARRGQAKNLQEAESNDYRYTLMNDDEVRTYNYYFETDEKKAGEYLKFLEEELNRRQGVVQGEAVRGIDNDAERAFLTAIYGVGAGLDQFASGAAQLVSSDRRATSAGQFGSAYIREDLGDTGPRLPEALGGASLAQVGYDALTTSANMAPSILLSTLTGGLGVGAAVAQGVGAATLGASAAGNAYSQALAEGYGKGEARLYSTLIGASEACLQNVLGGIGALGGMSARTAALVRNIDSSLLRISSNVALNMLAEGTEEYLQDILEPVFRNMVYGENNETPLWTPEATYSFLLGALTAGLVEGPNTVRTGIQMNRDGAKLKANHLDENLIQVALRLGEETDAYQTAMKIKAGTLDKTTHNIGELFYQYAADGGDMSVFDSRSESYSRMMELAKRRDGGYNNTREGTQTASTESPATTAYLALDGADKMGLLGARRVGAAVEKLLAGDALSDSEVKVLNLESAAKRGVFNQLTGLSLDESVNKLWSSAEGRAQVMEQIENGLAGQREQRAQNDISGTQELLREQIAANAAAREMNVVGDPASVYDPATVQTSAPTEEQGITLESFAEQYRSAVNPEASDQEVRDEFAAFLTSVYGPEEATARLRGATMTQEGNSTPTASESAESAADVPTDAVIHLDGQEVSLGDLIALNAEYAAQGQSDMTEQQIRDIFAQQYRAENSKEGMNDGGEEAGSAVRTESERRIDSVGAGESGGDVQTGAGEAESGRAAAGLRETEIRAAVTSAGAEKVSSRDAGLPVGTDSKRLYIVPEELYTDELRNLAEAQKARGREITFFVGDDLEATVSWNETPATANGAVSPDGSRMWARADDPNLTPTQIVAHEEFHAIKGEHPEIMQQIQESILREHTIAELMDMVDRYTKNYGWTNRDAESKLEEIYADAYAGVDIFAKQGEAAEGATQFSETVRSTVSEAQSKSGVDKTAEAAHNKKVEDFTTTEAKKRWAKDPKYKSLKHRRLAYIVAASDANVNIPTETLLRDPLIRKMQREATELSRTHSLDTEPVSAEKRQQIIDTMFDAQHGSYDGKGFTGPVRQDRMAFIVLGRPGGGKSSVFANPLSQQFMARIIDSDDVKPQLNGYNDGLGAGHVQQESSDIVNDARARAIENGDNIVLPVVGGDSTSKIVGELYAAGYTIHAYNNDVAMETGINRTMRRAAETGRFVDPDYQKSVGDRPNQVYQDLIDSGLVAYGEWRNNDVEYGKQPNLVDRQGTPPSLDAGGSGRGGRGVSSQVRGAVRQVRTDGRPADRRAERSERGQRPLNNDQGYKLSQTIQGADETTSEGAVSYFDENGVPMATEEELDHLFGKDVKDNALGKYQAALKAVVSKMQELGYHVPNSIIFQADTLTADDMVSIELGDIVDENPLTNELGEADQSALYDLLEQLGHLEDENDGAYNYTDADAPLVGSTGAPIGFDEMFTVPDDEELQTDRRGFTDTDTPEFRRWFHDDTGELTNEDGGPIVFVTGGVHMGKGEEVIPYKDKQSPGIWLSTSVEIARRYADGATGSGKYTFMDAAHGNRDYAREVPEFAAPTWDEAKSYVESYFSAMRPDTGEINGLLLFDGDDDSTVRLESNLMTPDDFAIERSSGSKDFTTDWRVLAEWPNTPEGLDRFNHEIGELVRQTGAGPRGWTKVFASARNTLVVDAKGQDFDRIPASSVPEKLRHKGIDPRHGTIPGLEHINDLARRVFDAGYDAMVVHNVLDSGGVQTQYIVCDSSQVKSVYNNGDWDANEGKWKFSQTGNGRRIDDFIRQFDAEHGEGAADRLFDSLLQLRETYGPLRESAGSVREAGLPARTEADNKVSRSAATVAGAKATPENRVLDIQQAVVDGKMSYVPIENKITANKAKNRLKLHGWTDSVRAWTDAVEQGRADADLVAMGATLLNNAGNSNASAEEYLDLLTNYAQLLRNAGQAVQAAKILQRMTPEGRLYGIERAVRKINERQGKGFDPTTGEFEGIQLDPALVEAFRNAQTEEERNEIIDQMAQDVANKMRTTNMERFTAWRYLNMLGNFRTQVRNVLGNAGFQLPRMVKDSAVGIVEAALERAGVRIERTSSVARDAETWRAAGEIFREYQDAILAGGKYQDNAGADFGGLVNEKRRIFGNTKYKAWNKTVGAALEKYRTTTNWAMDGGDAAFCSFTFRDSLSRFMAANHTTWAEASEELQTRAVNKAIRDAAEATYRDNNALSTWLAGLARSKSTPQVVKTIAEGVLPFRKTPANILMRAYEYSPLSIIGNTVTDIQAATGRRSVGANEIVEQWAKTFTGTGLVALGYALASMGALIGKAPDDEKEKTLFEQQGYQAYALMAGGHTYTLDWLAPECIPLFLGANLQQAAFENGLTLQEGMNAVMSIGDPILEMSMLQGVNDALENAATYGNDQALVSFVANALWSYATQGMTNTFVGQLERASTNTRMQTYVDKNGEVPTTLQRGIGKTSAKVPGWDYNQIPFIDAWGDTQQNADSETWNVITQLFSPSYVSAYRQSDTLRELERLYDATGEAAVILDVAPKYFNVGNERKDLTPDEYVMYAVTRGQAAKEAMAELMESESYRNLSDEEKVTAVKRVYDYANQQGKAAVSDYKPNNWAVNAKENADRLGISVAAYTTAYSLTKETASIKDRNGETVTNSKSLRIMQQLYALPELSEEQAKTLGAELGVSKTVLGYSKKMVENKLSAMERKYAAFN